MDECASMDILLRDLRKNYSFV